MRRAWLAAPLMLWAVACGGSAGAEVPLWWPHTRQSPLASDHPLVGRIWSTRDQKLVDPGEFAETLASATLVLLGEVHDNADHHRIQGWAIEVVAGRRAAAVVFEHIRADQQDAVDRFAQLKATAPPQRAAKALFELLEWDKSGWPPAETYKPLFESVIRSNAMIIPGDPPRAQVRAVVKSGPGMLEAAERLRLNLDRPLPAELQDDLLAELESSHCGLVPKAALTGMAEAQHYRDAHLARTLVDAADRYGTAVLIAGNGHVRRDRGVPWHLHGLAPGKSLVSVMLAEVEAGKNEAADYAETGPPGGAVTITDYIVFTPRVERADPCERMRGRAGQKG